MGVQADRLYVGDTLVWDGGGSGAPPVRSVFAVEAGVGEVAIGAAVYAVSEVTVDAPVRIRFYSTEEGRAADLDRSIYSPYPGGRCLVFELNATEAGTFDVPFIGSSPLLWAADAPASITVTWRSIA